MELAGDMSESERGTNKARKNEREREKEKMDIFVCRCGLKLTGQGRTGRIDGASTIEKEH